MTTLATPTKILTVEDNAIVSADVRAILEGAGYAVCPDARDGVQAIEHVRTYEPDLILMDLTLPVLDGFEAATRIRAESDAPILALTGHSDPETLERAEAAGTTGLVIKPFSEHGLLTAVRNRLAQRDSDDFSLRCLVEAMVREGADEKTIVRSIEGATRRAGYAPRSHGSRRTLWGELRSLLDRVARRSQ
ncbi:MAG: two-component system, response regulator PdtaR [Gaiellales bacterium]|nr:two-component system, response regulator PdtaR [Gaiellales bacterium]